MSYFQYKVHIPPQRRKNLNLSSDLLIQQFSSLSYIQILLIVNLDILQKLQFLEISLIISKTKIKRENQQVKVKLQSKLKHLYIERIKKVFKQNKRSQQVKMFVVEALFTFSALTLKQQENKQQEQKQEQKQEKNGRQENLQRNKEEDQEKQHLQLGSQQVGEDKGDSEDVQEKQQVAQISYLSFQKGDKILVEQAFENGWWYGNTLKQPQTKGFFPSNYVQTATKPKPPPPLPSQPIPQGESDNQVYDPNQSQGVDWVQNELSKITKGPVKSDYYLGIKGYKNVKIDEKNQNILKGDHVKYDVSTGLAKVPVKDQAPVAKAVRQMGYYFDYHQWVQQRNTHPGHKSRPDPKKKKIKKLNLKGMK